MPRAEVDWTDRAFQDLRDRVLDRRIQLDLVRVALTELRPVPDSGDEDEGMSKDGRVLWRRGISRQGRSRLDPNDLEIDAEYHAWDYVIVYRLRNGVERRRHLSEGFVVEAVVAQTQLWGEWLSMQ